MFNKQRKIVLEIIEANLFPHVDNVTTKEVTVKKPYLILGRGVELIELEDQNVDTFDFPIAQKLISRKHAKIIFPLSFFKDFSAIPSYFFKFQGKWKSLSKQLLFTIRQYSQTPPFISVVDLNSKYGLYQLISKKVIHEKEFLQFGNFNFCLQNMGKFDNRQTFMNFLKKEEEKQNILDQNINEVEVFGNIQAQKEVFVLRALYVSNNHEQLSYFLGQNNCQFTIGRLGTCDLQINRSQLSRKQGRVTFHNNQWIYEDGILNKASTNGSWNKTRMIRREADELEKGKGLVLKMGQVRVSLRLVNEN